MTATISRSSAILGAARTLAARLLLAIPIDRAALTQAMTESSGGNDAAGAWTQRESFEALEVAVAMAIPELVGRMDAGAAICTLEALAKELPTHTVRSEDQIAFQQFSTPPALACLAVHLARLGSEDIFLEPSAGTGIIAALARGAVKQFLLNELEPTRAALLEGLFPGSSVYRHDGAKIAALLSGTARPSVIVMNPPFSVSQSRGEDQNTAARHLRAALDHLLPGGRVVAIMPDWFADTARGGEVYRRTLEGARVVMSLRLDRGGYAKHGTGIAVRMLVIDKVPGDTAVSTINRASVSELFAALGPIPLRAALREASPVAVARPKLSMFRSVKSGPARPVIVRAPQTNEVRPVAYKVLQEAAAMGEQRGVYADYRPSRVVIPEAGEHPTHLVESAAMASIAAPRPGYVPCLPERTVTARLLSAAQLETVIYAGEAWSRDLHGRFTQNAGEVALKEDPEGQHYRTGFFLGDGTGAGKGRQAAACILDQWLKGNRRHIWISKNAPLLEDAQRDWTAIGGLPSDIIDLARWKIGEEITAPEGILFVPYGTLRSARVEDTRLDQIVRWAGPAFEGVVVFDEAHEMGGVAGGEGALGQKQGSLQGIAGVLLQNTLPRARVLYASATGASDVNNLAYAVRLGLWGPGTAFTNREQFISEIRDGGIAAMELVARDLKASGLYLARALSFAGIEYDILRHDLSPDQIAIYDTYCEAWTIIHQNLEAALELTGVVDGLENRTLNSGAKAAARSRFEGTKQRFFAQVLLSLKLPSIFPAIDEHLAQDESVVVQLVSTAESILNRRLNELDPEEREALELDLSPREAGTFDIGVETVSAETCEVLSDTVIRTDPVTGATSHLLELSLTQRRKLLSLERVLKMASYEDKPLFLRNAKSGKVALAIPAPSHMDEEGELIRRFELVRPLRSEYILAGRLDETAWESVSKAKFSALWEAEYAADENHLVTETVFLATGLLLPIWGALPKEDLTVNRIVDKTGASWLGRHVHDLYVDATLEKLGVSRKAQTDPAKIAQAILGGGTWKAPHPLNFTVRTSRVNGARRIEIVGAEAARIPELKAMGCFTEIIAYKTRVFVPGDKAELVLARLIA